MKEFEGNKTNKRRFENLSPTPQLAKGYHFFQILARFLSKPKTTVPPIPLPSVKTDLRSYYAKNPSIVWFGHSSYLIHCDGLNLLVDPVLSGYASPSKFYIKAFEGTDVYKPKDMPGIDCLLLTHNHYDHLDRRTIRLLAAQTRQYILPIGVGRDLRGLAVNMENVRELDWWQSSEPITGISITSTPARHFSGRGLRRNTSRWSSYVLEIKGHKIFIGGDSGYDFHFKEIGDRFGPFDIAILECGQYNEMWPYIHSTPEELIQEARDLRAQMVMPVHWGKFSLALHDWNEPVNRFVQAAEKESMPYTTPMIGEPVVLGEKYPKSNWWQLPER